ncbi:thioredoxin-like [Bolinopsis microptera]|uniref:thioredoxin-like n=1 Tax=Bolinopsis microptera TaxID=2820187 RepID=UPI003078EA8B
MIHIKDKGHFRKILQSLGNNKVLIVKYSTDWCGPCRIIAKSYTKLEKEQQKKFVNVIFAECDVDIAPGVAEDEGITCLPTIAGYMKGEKIESFMGSNKEKLTEFCVKMAKLATVPSGKVSRAEQQESGPAAGVTSDPEFTDIGRQP